jgi:hypothetical protein
MAGVPAPKKITNFPYANVLTANMTFLVADHDSGLNYQVTPAQIYGFVASTFGILNSSEVALAVKNVNANTTIDDTFAGYTIVFSGNTGITLTVANTMSDNVAFSIVNVSPVANVTVAYSGLATISAPTNIGQTRITFVKVANTVVGK